MLPQNLNKKQLEAVESPMGPLLIVAGAGSGKTKTLTSRLRYLLDAGLDPSTIIAITFTNKAASEMKSRVVSQMSGINGQMLNGRGPFIGTFHSLGARILRREAAHFERGSNFTIFDSDDSLSALKKTIKSLALFQQDKMGPAMFRFYISKIKNDLSEPAELTEGSKLATLTAVYEEYENALKRMNAFDFDDLIEKPVKLFTQNPAILNKYRARFKYILVDEFQDVNTTQYEFIKLLAKEHKNINVVGDDGQSVYQFRGANFRHFLNFEHDWPGAKVVLLEQNYRSTSTILNAANAVIANNKFQKKKNLWTSNPAGSRILVMEHRGEIEEAEWISSEVAKQIANSKSLASPELRRSGQIANSSVQLAISHLQFAILYRTNAQSRAIEQALIEREIPYQIFGSIRFYERKEIKDLVACLRYAHNPKDLVSLERLSKNFLKKPYLALQSELPAKSAELSPYELIVFAINTTKYFDYLKRTFPNAEERVENIEELLNFASSYTSLGEFLEKITLLQSNDNENSKSQVSMVNGQMSHDNAPAVVLMTIHIAKGLEFDKVFVAGCNEGLLPHQMSYNTPDEIEEERRLMYVAMTRAKKELALSFYSIGSRFLYEIPPELIEFQSSLSKAKAFFDDEERYISFD